MIVTKNLNLQNRIALISGASAGIGEAILRDLAFHGVRCVANARRVDKLQEIAAQLNAEQELVVPVVGDVSDEQVIVAMGTAAREKFGRDADLVIVNAGRGLPGSIVTSDTKEWEAMLRTNVLGAFLLMRHAAQTMQATVKAEGMLKRPLDIVVLGSCVGRNVAHKSTPYSASKFAVNSAAEGLRRELCKEGIRVSLVEPGVVRTEFHVTGKYGENFYDEWADNNGPLIDSDDVARVITFIVSQPPHVHLHDAAIRSVFQEYP